jgi:hypothetical protein
MHAVIIAPWLFFLFLAHNQNIPQQKKANEETINIAEH